MKFIGKSLGIIGKSIKIIGDPWETYKIVESVLFWMKEYHIDGFRFDLGLLIDWETVDLVRKEAIKINPDNSSFYLNYGVATSMVKRGRKMCKYGQKMCKYGQRCASMVKICASMVKDGP